VRLIHRLEPIWWLLFGAGGFVAALILPGLVIGLELGALGAFGDYATSYHRVHGLVSNPAGRVILAGVLCLVFWHSAHHLRHFALDLGLKRIEALVAYGVYGLALLSSLATIAAVAAL
jgi:fumarate reductase subunit D